jgi:hypothetical protein
MIYLKHWNTIQTQENRAQDRDCWKTGDCVFVFILQDSVHWMVQVQGKLVSWQASLQFYLKKYNMLHFLPRWCVIFSHNRRRLSESMSHWSGFLDKHHWPHFRYFVESPLTEHAIYSIKRLTTDGTGNCVVVGFLVAFHIIGTVELFEKKMKYDTSYLNNFPIYYILLEEIDGNFHS